MFNDAALDESYPLLASLSEPVRPAERQIVGRDHEMVQLLASMSRPELCNALLLAPPGSGKLLPLDTPIPTPSGWTTMGDLQPGDEVLGRDGRPTKVSYVSDVDESPVLYDITLSDGQVITACADHQWLVADVDGRARTYPRSVAETKARRAKAEARSEALFALSKSHVPEFVSVRELLGIIASVTDITWTKPIGLHTYLKSQGVERRRVGRQVQQNWKGGVRTTIQYTDEFNTRIALKALSEQAFRRTTWADDGSAGETVMTTREMVDAGVRTAAEGRIQFSIRLTDPIDLPDAELRLDPYVLGAWLGDGSVGQGSLTQGASDACTDEFGVSDQTYLTARLEESGYAVSVGRDGQNLSTPGLKSVLREVGVLACKHIPLAYQRASIQQRLALLQGLMDTDGTVGMSGSCELALSDERLARDAEQLIRSLGIKVNRTVNPAGYRNETGELAECKNRHRMKFTTTLPVFRLPRKAARLPESVRPTQQWLYITDITPAVSRPGKCIQVDNDEHMYLAGEGFIPTHNTHLVQSVSEHDPERLYLDVDPSRMRARGVDSDQMAATLKSFFDEAELFVKKEGQELVLFIDEFHQIVQLSDAAVEAIKPVLAASGARGIRVIAATTYEEFHQRIAPNQPLVERLQRINLSPPDKDTTVQILQGMAERYEVGDQFLDDHLFQQIYEYTERYMPASSQPRKSILVLDSMVGWHRFSQRPIDRDLLAVVLKESLGVDVAFRVDGAQIKQQLDQRVFSQDLATSMLARRLQLSVADLNDKSRPEASFLFAGSTGVGKGTLACEEIPVLTKDGRAVWKKASDLVPGEDRTFGRRGQPQELLGVFPQGEQDVYCVSLSDGRSLVTDGQHLWGVYPFKKDRSRGLTVLSTETLALRLAEGKGRATKKARYSIPMNGPVQWPEVDLRVHPYVMGALIADGALTPVVKPLVISSDDEFVVAKVADLIGATGHDRYGHQQSRGTGERKCFNYKWQFASGRKARRGVARIQKKDVIGDFPEVMDRYSTERRIPEIYLTAAVGQRWELVKGLFDCDGTIGAKDDSRFNVSYSTSSPGLAEDVRHLLLSLGVTASITANHRRSGNGERRPEYTVHARSSNQEKHRFFSLPRKLEIAERAAKVVRAKTFDFDYVDIVSVTKLEEKAQTACIYVGDHEHLYQASRDFVVTHNTELAKQLSRLLFGDDQRHLIRFDCTEFASEDSFHTFRSELTKKVWDLSHAVLLFDEIEKAHSMVTRVLLQVLDDGRLSDDNNREVSFLNTYIVLTTNAGSEIFSTIAQYAADDTGSGAQLLQYDKLIRRSISTTSGDNRFPPELLGRIDAIVPFQPLSLATQQKIVRNKLRELVQEVLIKHNVQVTVDTKVLQYLIEDKGDTDSDAGGARHAVAKVTDEVATSVATFINQYPRERRIRVDILGDLVSDDKTRLSSDAHVEVSAWR